MTYQQMCDNIKAGTMSANDLEIAFNNMRCTGFNTGYFKGFDEGLEEGEGRCFATVKELIEDLEKD